ncbi:chitobiase/beta-hexosaminidase C-terminal domain-containing protein [Anaerocolumna xylanovorans]|uniref:Exo-1,3-beta-glucanase D n=1 Tax=Anaerocolumna xylanovorans DSM 12503 TaxID=1121345 RepID=A0A1M7XXA3_9FIRM|nr:chitobiase/beta-hexosaminidase C-terminal domain-containing protein [Anaerocolumna xylanovorans]SHO43352.1 Ig-like domain (group 2) [Anaerocolumna xylanovorans DSM 12503]
MKKGIFVKKSWKKWVAAALTLTLVFNAGLPGQKAGNTVSAAGSDKVVFTDFESTDYTAGAYGNSITRDSANVLEGNQAFQYVQGGEKKWDNDFKIRSVSGSAIDVSSMTKVVVNVKDTVGSNNFEVKLIDASGKNSAKYTSANAVKDQWTTLEVPLDQYSGIDKTAISQIAVWEWNDGDYYFDDIHFEDADGHRMDFQDFEHSLYYNTNNGTNKLTQADQNSGSASLLYNQGTAGGGGEAIINPGKENGADASGKTYIVLWVKDTTGDNNFKLALTDTDGNTFDDWTDGSNSLQKAVKNQWKEIAVPLSKYSTNGVNLSKIAQIKIYEWNAGDFYIDDIYFTNTLPPNPPAADYGEGNYTESFQLTLTAPEDGGTIYYTTNETKPTEGSAVYAAPIAITASTVVKAVFVKDGESSRVLTLNYTIIASNVPKKAVLEDFEGTPKVTNGTVTDKDKYQGTKSIAYTLTASADPTEGSSLYVEGNQTDTSVYSYLVFWLKDTQGANTVKLGLVDKDGNKTGFSWINTLTTEKGSAVKNTWTEYAVKLNSISGISNIDRTAIKGIYIGEWNSGTYYIDDIYFTNNLLPVSPKSNYASGTYEKLEGVTLTTTTLGCDIYYTTDGSTPTKASAKYQTPFNFTENTVVKAVAIRQSDEESSAVAEFNYHVKALPTSAVVPFNNFDDGIDKVTAQAGAKISSNTKDSYQGKSITYEMNTLSGSPTETLRSITIKPEDGMTADVRLSRYLVFYVKDEQAYNNTRMFIKDDFGNEASAWTDCSTKYGEWSMYYVDLSTMENYKNLDLAFIKEVTFGFYNTGTYLIDEMYFTDKLYTGLPGAEKPALSPAAGEVLTSLTPGTYGVFAPVELAAEKGADIYYTLDGKTDPADTAQAKKYSGVISLTAPAVIKAVSIKDSAAGSVYTFDYTIKPGTVVTIFGNPGTYDKSVIVALRSSKDDTPVYYTLDGSEPTTDSIRYNSPFRIEESTTIKAIGYDKGVASDVKTFDYIIQGTEAGVKAPKASLAAGIYGAAKAVALTTGTAGAAIHYTTDGTTPAVSSPLYEGEITINTNTILKAIALKDGKASSISEYQYTIKTNPSNFLKADGKKIRNNYGTGEEVILRGTNAGGWLVTENWQCPVDAKDMITLIRTFTERFGSEKTAELIKQYQDNWWTADDFDLVKAEGINVLRLPITYFEMLNDDGSLKTSAFERLDWFIKEAKKRDIYVMIDMHGAVGSQNGKDHSGDTTIADIGNFYGNEENINKTIVLWKEIAKRYKNESIVCGYDLLNEPSATKLVQYDVYDRIYKAIREVDKDHMIFIQGIWNPTDLPDPSLYGWENVVYQYHFYQWSGLTDATVQSDFIKDKIKMINETTNYNVPSFIGEFTFFSNTDSWKQCMDLIEAQGYGYTTWTFKVSDGGEGSSWGLYTGKSNPVLINTDSYENIIDKWSTIKTTTGFTRNSKFADVLKVYFTKNRPLAVPYSESSGETPEDNGNTGNDTGNNNGNNNSGSNQTGNNSGNTVAAAPVISDTQIKDGKAVITMSLSQAELQKAAAGKDKLTVSSSLPESELAAQLKEGRDISLRMDLTQAMSISNVEIEKILLTKNIMEQMAAAQKSIDVALVLKDVTLNWHFDGALIKASQRPVTDVNLMGQASVIAVTGDSGQKGLKLSLNHSGLLPSTAIITVTAGNLINEAGLTVGGAAFVYYYDKEAGKLLEIPNNNVKVGSGGEISVPVTHCSDYVILAKKPDKSLLVTLLDQIKVTADKIPVYVNGTTGNTKSIKVTLPQTLVKEGSQTTVKDSGIDTAAISYSSSDKKIALVDKNGKVTGKKAGKATITVTAKLANGTSRNIKVLVTVKNAWVEVIKAPKTIKSGKTGGYLVAFHGFKDSDITWMTTKKGAAVTGKNTGKAAVTVKGTTPGKDTVVILSKGKKIKTFNVTVTK